MLLCSEHLVQLYAVFLSHLLCGTGQEVPPQLGFCLVLSKQKSQLTDPWGPGYIKALKSLHPYRGLGDAISLLHPQSSVSLPATSSQTRSQPFSACHTRTPLPPNLFISRSEADLISLVEAGHAPPCQGLAWRLLAPGGPSALPRLCTARLQLPQLWPADPKALQSCFPQLRQVPYPDRGRETLNLNSNVGQQMETRRQAK